MTQTPESKPTKHEGPYMSARETHIEAITAALRSKKVTIDRIGDTLNARMGMGRMATKANLDLEPILSKLEDADATTHAHHIAAFTSGALAVLSEPAYSRAHEWTYEQTAGRMMLNIEGVAFVLGVSAAAADEPWFEPLDDELIVVTYIELDRGYRVVTRAQLDAWGATSDRIFSAGRSMLYHKSREVRLVALDGSPQVTKVSRGDGYDSARALVLPEVFYIEIDEPRFRFAIPNQDTLLYIQGEDEAALEALEVAAAAEFHRADYPLSSSVYSLEPGRPPRVVALGR